MLKGGWEIKQQYTQTPASRGDIIKYYQWEFQPFIEVKAQIISTLKLMNIWQQDLTIDLDQFKTNVFISLIFNENLQVCPGIGFDSEKILLKVLHAMRFWECKKTLIDDLADFSSTWTGVNAKYFEDCSQSNTA